MKCSVLTSVLLLMLLPALCAATPEFAFPSGLNWKAVFDSGFRPKHVPGLERDRAECVDQELVFKVPGRPGFPLERGRLMFELRSDDSLRIIEHVGRVPISMEEGASRLETFRDLFPEALKRAGSVPPLMDPERGGVAALGNYYALAEDEGYTIHYGFTASFQPDKPLLPVFMVALRHKMDEPSLPIRRRTVEPPEGYEWYSLDPNVDTPDPGSEVRDGEEESDPAEMDGLRPPRKESVPVEAETVDQSGKKSVGLVLAVGLLLIAMVGSVWRRLRYGSK